MRRRVCAPNEAFLGSEGRLAMLATNSLFRSAAIKSSHFLFQIIHVPS